MTGNQPRAKLTITATPILTSEAAVEGGTDIRPADAVEIAKVTTEITGNGTFESPKIKAPWQAVIEDKWLNDKKANVSWYETIPETATTEAWTGKYLLPSETVPFEKPVIVTKASPTGQVPLAANDTG
ncbi:hypothetical protein GWI34_43940, partial [Actinomadura sp. DSM 109109]|nr:hypothetical protein [Actinomadura lepetitiana]